MPLICMNCGRKLEYSHEPPRFCAFCGNRLPAADVTAAYEGMPPPSSDDGFPHEQVGNSAPGQVGEYRLLRMLGAGGMGTVYEAISKVTEQKVAVKLLSSQFTANPLSVERFRQEGKLASQISHPRCVFVVSADTDNGRPYIVMELMPGQTLKDLVDRQGPMSPNDAIMKILDVIEGLQEAHRLGVIHRDVKPSNCFLLDDGRVKIGDFGLSKSLTHNQHLTQTGAFLGTVLYASPEQILGQEVGYASDVYSVCATLYYLLSGRAPFEHESVTAALARVISEDPPPLSSIRPDIPKGLERVVMCGLERSAENRFPSLDELHDALIALIPSHLSLGGLWVRVGAYIIDELVVRLAIILPLTLLLTPLGVTLERNAFLALVIFPLYFVILEGRYGASIGKRCLRLRVCKAGTTDPPGYLHATIRTLIFFFLVIVTLTGPRMMIEEIDENGLSWNLLTEGIPFIIGLLILIVPMRRATDYRGLHEWLSRTCVLRLPLRRAKFRLTSLHGERLAQLPPPAAPLPRAIGPFLIQAASLPNVDGERVLVGEDTVLGRRVVMLLYPATEVGTSAILRSRFDLSRPARLRALGFGELLIDERVYQWEAFVAPTGTPLVDAIDEQHRLPWSTTRSILSELADELAIAEREGNLPETLSLQQVWVESNGHAQLLDFVVPQLDSKRVGPLPRSDEARAGLKLLGKVASLALEGKPRDPDAEPGDIRTALPLSAARVLAPLMHEGKAFTSTDDFRSALHAIRDEPVEVSSIHRLGQIGVQFGFLSIGLLLMFLMSGLHDFVQWLVPAEAAWTAQWVLEQSDTEHGQLVLATMPANIAQTVNDPAFRQKLIEWKDREQNRANEVREQLRRGPKVLARTIEDAFGIYDPDEAMFASLIARVSMGSKASDAWFTGVPFLRTHRQQTIGMIIIWPFVWAIGAYLLAGGLSFPITGLSIRRANGKRVPREILAARSLMIWLPISILLVLSVMMPGGAICWWLALIALVGYTAVIMLTPERAPHDRLLGLRVVPR